MPASRTTRCLAALAVVASMVLGPAAWPGGPAGLGLGVALAQQRAKPALAIVPLSRREGVKQLAAARIEEYLRAMVEAGGVVSLVPEEAVTSGRAVRRRASSARPGDAPSEAQRQLDKADEALMAGRDALDAGDDLVTAYGLLSAAIKRFETYFVELVDFNKLVDAYARAADAALRLGKKADAKALVTKALTIQPTFVVDNRRGNPELIELLKDTRAKLDKRRAGAIAVTANVEGAAVFVDGVRLGDAPAEAKELWPGTHYVQVRKEGAEPWGRAVTVRGSTVKVTAKLEVEEDEGTEIALAVRFTDIKPLTDKGEFHTKLVRNYSIMFAKQLRAAYLLYGTLAATARGVELHLFLFSAKERQIVALDPVEFAGNLSNMQMKILEAEGSVRAAVGRWPASRAVSDVPEVYTRVGLATDTGRAGPPPVAAAPTPPTTAPPVAAPTTPPGEPAPREPEPPPVRSPVVTGPPPAPSAPIKPATDPYAGLVKDDDRSIVKTWWFWTALGVVVAGGAGTAAWLLTREQQAAPNFRVDAQVVVEP